MGHRGALEEKALPFLSLHATINEILVSDLSKPQSSSVVDLNTAISKTFPQAASEGTTPHSFYDELLAASPHSFPPRNINERQALFQTTSPVEVRCLEGRKAALSEELVMALTCFSDELNLNETTCLNIWVLVSSKENRDALSDQFGCELGHDVPLAARRLFLLDRSCLLVCIREIVQASLDTNLPQETSRDFKHVLNNLVKSGLVSNLLKTVREVTQLGTNASSSSSQYGGTYQQSSSIPSTTMAFLDVQRLRAAECCFYMFFRMQVTAEEVLALASVCQLVSGQLANELSGEPPLHGHGGTLGNNSHHLESRWGVHEVSLLQTSQALLMALACALDRNHILMDRMTQQPNMFGVGNGLWKRGGSMVSELLPVQHLIMESKWEHAPSQGIAAFIWANFVAPSAALNPQDAAAVKSALEFVVHCRTFSFLRSCVLGPSRYRWLRDPIRKDGGGAQELCLSVLADLILGYLRFTCSEGGAGEGLPVSKLRYQQEFEFNMRHFTNQQQTQQQPQISVASRPSANTEDVDCLDDVLLLVSDACEAFPNLITVLWGTASSADESGNVLLSGSSLGTKLLTLIAYRARTDDSILSPYMRLLSGMAVGPSHHALLVYQHLRSPSTTQDWTFFFSNMENLARQLAPSMHSYHDGITVSSGGSHLPPASGSIATNSNQPNDVALTPRVVDLLLSLCTVVQCVAIHPQVNSALLSPDLRMWDSLLSLLACPPAPPVLKGALFKALAATISGSGDSSQSLAATMWQHIHSAHMLVGLKQELDTVEAMARIYPETDGFLCLLERLTLFHVPYNTELIGSVVEFLVSDVVLKAQGRDYAHQGERWRMSGRALSILHTLLRRYQLPGCGGSWEELGLVGDGLIDARQFHLDFGQNIPRAYQATAAASQVQVHDQHWGSVDCQETASSLQEGRQEIQQWGEGARRTAQYGSASAKSPGYNILLHIISGGPLFRAVAGILSEGEGCLAESRDSSVRRAIVASLHSFSSVLDEGTYTNCGEDPYTVLFASRDASKEDWSWWHERSVCMCLSLLLVASEKESCFRDQLRTCMVTASSSTSATSAVSASATLGDLLADDTFFKPIPAIARFVDYPPSTMISLLSARLILRLSRNLAPQRMLSALQVGEGMNSNIIRPFVRRFSSVVKRFAQVGQNTAFSGLCCLSGTCDPVFWSVPSSLLLSWPQDNTKTVSSSSSVVGYSGLNATTSHVLGQEGCNIFDGGDADEEDARGGIGEEKAAATLSLLLCKVILDILLVSVSYRGSSLSLVLLFGSEATPNCLSSASDVVLDLNNHPDTKKQPRCIQLVLDLLLFPSCQKSSSLELCEPVVAERCLHLVCNLLSNPVTSSVISRVLACSRFFQGMPRRAFVATAEPNPPAKLHAVAWLLRSIALSLYLSYKVHALPSCVLDMAKGLFAELFDADDTGSLPLLELISALPVCGPPPDAPGSGLRLSEVLREATVPLSGPQDICRGFNCVDVPRLRLLLSDAILWMEGSASGSSNDALIWAMEYNAYVERLASLRHLTSSCAQMAEVIVIGCSGMMASLEDVPVEERGQFNNANGGLRSSSSFSVGQKEWGWRSMYHVLGRLLGKISDPSTDTASLLLEPLAHACVTTMGSLQDMGLGGLPTVVEGEKILGTILLAVTSVGSGGSRQGSALLRSRLYTCLLMHLQIPRKATAPLLGEKGLPLVKAVQLEEEHNTTNRSVLIDAIGSGPLITILQRDAGEGTPMLRSISLSVLAEVFQLLNCGSDISELACRTAISTLSSKDFLHQAVALVGKVLCGQIRSTTAAGTPKTDGGFLQTGIGGHIHSSVLDSACALLLQVSGSEEGARALMDSGLVTWLSEGEAEREKTSMSFTQPVHEDGRGRDGGKPYSLLYPALQLVLALLTALPRNEKLVTQVIGFVQKNAKSFLYVLRLRVASLDALRAAGTVICILSHLIKSPFENTFTNGVGKYADKLSAAAVSLFVTLARSPYPNLSVSSRTAETTTNRSYDAVHHKVTTWWSVKPTSTVEEKRCTILVPPPPGMVLHDGCEWTLFDADRLEEGARVMCHAATFLRLRSSYSPQQSIGILSLADCIVACHKVYRFTNSESSADGSSSSSNGSGRYGYLRASTLHVLECLVATAQSCCSSLHGGGSHEELAILTPPLDSLARDSDKHPFLKMAVRKTVDALQS
eukprot:122689_1